MRKPNFTPVLVWLIKAFIAAGLDAVMINWIEHPDLIVEITMVIGVFIVLLFIIDKLWIPVAQIITKAQKKYNLRSVSPQMDYSFKQRDDKVYLRVKSSSKNKKLVLRLDFVTPEPRWLADESTRYEIAMRFVNVHRKPIYLNQELSPGLIELPEPVARIGDGYLALIAHGWDIPIPLGRYMYQLHEQGVHKGQNFGKLHKFLIEVKEGSFTYEKEN